MSTKKRAMNLSAKPAPTVESFIAGTLPPAQPPAPAPVEPAAVEELAPVSQDAPRRGRPAGEPKNPRNIKITDKLYKEAKYLAVDRGISFSDLVALALEDYLERAKAI